MRGGALDPDLSTADAVRFRRRYPGWDRYGISAFLAADDHEIDVLCETRLERFGTVAVFRRTGLEEAGIEIVPPSGARTSRSLMPTSIRSSTACVRANIEC